MNQEDLENKVETPSKKRIVLTIIFALLIIVMFIYFGLYFFQKQVALDKEREYIKDLNFMGIESEREIGKDLMEIDYIDNLTYSITYPEIGIEEIDTQIKDIITKLKDDFVLTYRSYEGDKTIYSDYIIYETYLAPDDKFSLILTESQLANNANVIFEKVYIYIFDLKTNELVSYDDIFTDGYNDEVTNCLIDFFDNDEKYKDIVSLDYSKILNNKKYKIAIKNSGILVYFDKYEILPGSYGIVKVEIDYEKLKDYLKINEEDKVLPPNSGDILTSGETNNTETVPSGDVENIIPSGDNIRYATATVNIREQPTVNSKRLGSLKDGESITIISELEGWTKVYYNDGEGYINSNYLSKVKVIHKVVELNIVDRGIDPTKPMVAITYDDGPNPISTPRILDTLEKYGAVATFFDLGQLVNSYPNIVKREEEIGCEVGSHTYSHRNLNSLSEDAIRSEITKSETAIENALGHKPTLVRPPYGNANSFVKQIVEYPLINWNVDSLDWKSRNKNKILEQIRKTKNFDGKIILLHSIYGTTADATEVLVPELIDQGYQLVTVSELAYYKGKQLETGKVYTNF